MKERPQKLRFDSSHVSPESGAPRLAALLGFIVAVVGFVFIALIIRIVYHPATDLSGAAETFLPSLDHFVPEPVERAQYLASILSFPLILLAATFGGRRLLTSLVKSDHSLLGAYNALLAVTALLILALAWVGMFLVNNAYGYVSVTGFEAPVADGFMGFPYFLQHRFIALLALAAIAILMFMRPRLYRNRILTRVLPLLYLLPIFPLVAYVVVERAMGNYTLTESGTFTMNFNAVFHAVTQVYLGKALLIDLISQYGLFPQLLEPIFRVTGLSVLRFTLTMGVLSGIALLAIYMFLRDALASRTIRFLGFATFVFFGFFITQLVTGMDPYFQYMPIRTLFPCLMIFTAWRYFASGGKRWYLAGFVVSAISILWNSETGLVVFLAWLLALLFQELGRHDFRAGLRAMASHLGVGSAALLGVFGLFTIYMRLRYGAFPDFNQALEYQRIFYQYSFMMLPMPPIHPWNIVALVYGLGLMFAVRSLVAREVNARASMIFFLSILGAGIFSYYEGRSHEGNLAAVWYPAVVLLVIFADSLWVRTREAPRDWLRQVLLAIMLLGLVSSVFNLIADPRMLDLLKITRTRLENGGPTPIMASADFIRNNTSAGDQVLILSLNSGFYYLASGTTCPIAIPGPSELVLRKDYDAITGYIAGEQADKIFVDPDFLSGVGWLDPASLLGLLRDHHYQQTPANHGGNIILFSRQAGG